MTLNIDGKQVNQLIINKNLFTYEGHVLDMQSAAEHNAKLGGTSLGTFNDDYAQRIASGSFQDLWVGDYFTVNGHKYKIAGFNYKANHEENKELGNHLIMLTDVVGQHSMNPTDTTAGGFAGTDLFKNYFPQIENQLQTDFGNHLLTFKSYLSTSIDGNGAPNNGQWYSLKACMCNSAMWWGKPSQYSNNANGVKFNFGDEDTQLPIMKLKKDEQEGTSDYIWLRDIANSTCFVAVDGFGSEQTYGAHGIAPCSVRAFFLID